MSIGASSRSIDHLSALYSRSRRKPESVRKPDMRQVHGCLLVAVLWSICLAQFASVGNDFILNKVTECADPF